MAACTLPLGSERMTLARVQCLMPQHSLVGSRTKNNQHDANSGVTFTTTSFHGI